MAKGLDSVFRRASRLNQSMKNGEVRTVPGARINGGRVAVYKAQNGMMNVLGTNATGKSIARYFPSGKSFPVGKDALRKYDFYQKAQTRVFNRGVLTKKALLVAKEANYG